jgi:hypothetical protein
MRKNAKRVSDLQNQMVQEIKNWLAEKNFSGLLELKTNVVVQVDVKSPSGDDWGTEGRLLKYLTIDGFIVDEYDEEIGINELNPYEIAFILDELDEGKYTIEE